MLLLQQQERNSDKIRTTVESYSSIKMIKVLREITDIGEELDKVHHSAFKNNTNYMLLLSLQNNFGVTVFASRAVIKQLNKCWSDMSCHHFYIATE